MNLDFSNFVTIFHLLNCILHVQWVILVSYSSVINEWYWLKIFWCNYSWSPIQILNHFSLYHRHEWFHPKSNREERREKSEKGREIRTAWFFVCEVQLHHWWKYIMWLFLAFCWPYCFSKISTTWLDWGTLYILRWKL